MRPLRNIFLHMKIIFPNARNLGRPKFGKTPDLLREFIQTIILAY